MRIHFELEKDGVKGTLRFSMYEAERRAELLMKAGAREVKIIEVTRVKCHNYARRVAYVLRREQ